METAAGCDFDAVVIGSGYGGSAVAARLAPHLKTLIVERGRQHTPADLPRDLRALAAAYRTRRNPTGLWGMRLGDGVGAAYVNAVGGSSVVNYGITARPDDEALARWPLGATDLAPYYERAENVLQATPSPVAPTLGDVAFLDRVEPGQRELLRNTIDWGRCTQCGACVLGCREGAKRSLDVTYLALAQRQGAVLRAGTEVVDLAPADGAWRVAVRPTGAPGGAREWLTTRRVILCAGTFGTLERLGHLRRHAALSWHLGERMSMNGDAAAFLYNTPAGLDGHHGAPISAAARLRFRGADGAPRTLFVMSGRIPRPALHLAAAALAALAGVVGRDIGPRDGPVAALACVRRRLVDLARVGPGGALAHTFMYKLDGQDEARGRARFDASGAVVMDWPDYAQDPLHRFAAERLQQWARRVGGVLVPDVGTLPGMRSFGVHALGGARLGTSVDDGVVDSWGRVLAREGDGRGVVGGLYAADDSILPGPPGVPPSLTIAALAERVAEGIVIETGTGAAPRAVTPSRGRARRRPARPPRGSR